jgi:hypothetical protein
MDNLYLQEQIARMRREEMVARSEHQRLIVENGLDLMSVLRRAIAQRLAQFRRPAAVRRVARTRRVVRTA